MKRDKKWWSRLTKLERKELLLLESYHRLYIEVQVNGASFLPNLNRTLKLVCPICEIEEYFHPLCSNCTLRMKELIKKGDGTS